MKRIVMAGWFAIAILCGGMTSAQAPQAAAPAKKEFLYRLQAARVDGSRTGPSPEELAIINQHLDYLQDLTAKGVVILAGRTLNYDETSFGMVILRAASEDAAREVMNSDPGVKKGLFLATLFPYRVIFMEGHPVP